MTAVGFEPTQLALVELESTPLDHSGKLSIQFCRDIADNSKHICLPAPGGAALDARKLPSPEDAQLQPQAQLRHTGAAPSPLRAPATHQNPRGHPPESKGRPTGIKGGDPPLHRNSGCLGWRLRMPWLRISRQASPVLLAQAQKCGAQVLPQNIRVAPARSRTATSGIRIHRDCPYPAGAAVDLAHGQCGLHPERELAKRSEQGEKRAPGQNAPQVSSHFSATLHPPRRPGQPRRCPQ